MQIKIRTKKIVPFFVETVMKMTEINKIKVSCFPLSIGLLEFYLTLNHVYIQKAQLFAIFEAKIQILI